MLPKVSLLKVKDSSLTLSRATIGSPAFLNPSYLNHNRVSNMSDPSGFKSEGVSPLAWGVPPHLMMIGLWSECRPQRIPTIASAKSILHWRLARAQSRFLDITRWPLQFLCQANFPPMVGKSRRSRFSSKLAKLEALLWWKTPPLWSTGNKISLKSPMKNQGPWKELEI